MGLKKQSKLYEGEKSYVMKSCIVFTKHYYDQMGGAHSTYEAERCMQYCWTALRGESTCVTWLYMGG
jgi:hypothetical protein